MPEPIKTKADRSRLKQRREPYWERVRKGCYLGYRVSLKNGDGTWHARMRDEDGKQNIKALGHFNSFDEAQREAERWFNHFGKTLTRDYSTVADCCRDYVKEKRHQKQDKNADDAEGRFKQYVFDTDFGNLTLDRLRASDVRGWRDKIKGKPATVNRNLSVLLAALNFAHDDGKVADDSAWAGVSKLKDSGEGSRRNRWLSKPERKAFLESCTEDLRCFCAMLLLTGARPGEVASCKTGSFDAEARTLKLREGKTGARPLPLTPTMFLICESQAKGKNPDDWLFTTSSGLQWSKNQWTRPVREARTKAGFGGDVTLYTLRHTGLSVMIMSGVSPFIVAQYAGTSTKMIDEHYGHLIPEGVSSQLETVDMI